MNTYNTTKNVELAFIPCPGLSHFVPTVESAKHLLECDPRVSITVLIMKLHTDPALEKYKQTLISSSRLRFLTLPAAPDSSTSALPFKAIHGQAAHVKAAISDLIESPGSRLAGLVLDVLTTSFLDIADEFGLPSYVFSVTSASSLGLMFHLTSSTSCNTGDLENLANNENEQLSVPCFLNPVPKKVLPDPFLGEGPEPDTIIGFLKRISEAKGVLMNTFRELEPFVVESLLMSSSAGRVPKVYPVGPVLMSQNNSTTAEDGNKIWLDRQPEGSVVFLCFGTMGSFEAEQVKEIATALEKSGKRFLWSLRKPEVSKAAPTEYGDYNEVLPEGFLERTEAVGRVTGWADQVGVLAHRAVGGFVSHCGWNSTLESVWFGVPVATFPLYADHQMVAFLLVKEMEMAEEIRIDYHVHYKGGAPSEIVGAGEIEAAIRRLMEGESGVRRKVKEMQRKSREALMEGGSSYNAQKDFIEDVINNIK